MTTKTFPVADVIAAHSGVMIVNSFYAICAVADHVAGQPLTTHQMATARATLAAALERQHPFLGTLDVPSSSKNNFHTLGAFLAEIHAQHGGTLDITTDPSFPGLHLLDGLPENSVIVTIPDVR